MMNEEVQRILARIDMAIHCNAHIAAEKLRDERSAQSTITALHECIGTVHALHALGAPMETTQRLYGKARDAIKRCQLWLAAQAVL